MNLNNQPRGLDIQLLEPTRIILFFSVRIFLYFPAFAPTSATTTSTTVLLFMGGGSPIYCKHSHYDGAVPGGGFSYACCFPARFLLLPILLFLLLLLLPPFFRACFSLPVLVRVVFLFLVCTSTTAPATTTVAVVLHALPFLSCQLNCSRSHHGTFFSVFFCVC